MAAATRSFCDRSTSAMPSASTPALRRSWPSAQTIAGASRLKSVRDASPEAPVSLPMLEASAATLSPPSSETRRLPPSCARRVQPSAVCATPCQGSAGCLTTAQASRRTPAGLQTLSIKPLRIAGIPACTARRVVARSRPAAAAILSTMSGLNSSVVAATASPGMAHSLIPSTPHASPACRRSLFGAATDTETGQREGDLGQH